MNGFMSVKALLACGLVFCFTQAASADDGTTGGSGSGDQSGEADSAISDAIEMFQAGAYSAAIAKFKRAYELIHDPNILFNVARCYQELGQKDQAIDYYSQFINHPDVPEDAKSTARERLKQLEDKPSDQSSSPDSDGASAPTDSGEAGAVQFDSSDTGSKPRVLEWALIGAGAAITIAGAAFGGVALSKHNDFESSHDRDEKEDFENTGRTMALTSDISLGVGVATMATGLILMFVRKPKEKEETPTASFIPSATPNGADLSCVVRF